MFMHLLSKVLVVLRKKKFFHFTYPLRGKELELISLSGGGGDGGGGGGGGS